jgi:DNA-binding GntR family transcriptional regulator
VVELALRSIDSLRGPSAADLVFDELYRRVMELDLPPGTRLSEAEVAKQMGTSRQPVRDAFYRLSQVGLLQIQPQRATTISRISEEAVLQARFIRTALETETVRAATEALTDGDLSDLDANLAEQRTAMEADDRVRFHALDDAFHRAICACSGNEFAWGLIRINKAHMDRVRYLSLGFHAHSAYDDHVRILEALRDRDAVRGTKEMRLHLSRITDILAKLRAEQPAIFAEPTTG